MGLLSFLSPLTHLFGGGGNKKEDPIAALQRQIQPLIDEQLATSKKTTDYGLGDVGASRKGYGEVVDYWKNVMNGNPDDLMKLLDSSNETRNIDENMQQLGESGVRGGVRAAALGNQSFDRSAALNRVLTQLRNAAPSQLAQLYQAMGNLGLGELSAAGGSGAQASNNIFGITNAQLSQQQIKNQQIAQIIGAISSAAGAAFGAA